MRWQLKNDPWNSGSGDLDDEPGDGSQALGHRPPRAGRNDDVGHGVFCFVCGAQLSACAFQCWRWLQYVSHARNTTADKGHLRRRRFWGCFFFLHVGQVCNTEICTQGLTAKNLAILHARLKGPPVFFLFSSVFLFHCYFISSFSEFFFFFFVVVLCFFEFCQLCVNKMNRLLFFFLLIPCLWVFFFSIFFLFFFFLCFLFFFLIGSFLSCLRIFP